MFFRVDRGIILLVESLEVCILKTSLYAKGAGGGKKVNESAYRPWFFFRKCSSHVCFEVKVIEMTSFGQKTCLIYVMSFRQEKY